MHLTTQEGKVEETRNDVIMNSEVTVRSGHHLIVEVVMKSTITVEGGAQLTVTGSLMKSKIICRPGSVFECHCTQMKSDIVWE